jgi:hypothetical protein
MASNSQSSFFAGNAVNGAERGSYIPTKILEQDLLSDTNNAYDCFVYRRFSSDLQAFLVGYVMSVNGYRAVYM